MLEPIKPRLLTRKPYPLPKGLVYKYMRNDYSLAETATGKLIGTMNAGATTFDPNYLYKKKEPEDKIFHIYSIKIKKGEQYKGWGKYFMDFAKSECYKEGCEGRMSLVAYNRDCSPHIFYWKQGFRSNDNKTNHIIEHCLKKHQEPFFLEATAMYLPIDESPKKTKISKMLNKFRVLFSF